MSSVRDVTPASGPPRPRTLSRPAAGEAGDQLRQAEEVSVHDRSARCLAPEPQQERRAFQLAAALAEQFADPRIFQVAGLGERGPAQVGALGLADLGVGAANRQQSVEGDHELGRLLADDLKVAHHAAGVVLRQVDE